MIDPNGYTVRICQSGPRAPEYPFHPNAFSLRLGLSDGTCAKVLWDYILDQTGKFNLLYEVEIYDGDMKNFISLQSRDRDEAVVRGVSRILSVPYNEPGYECFKDWNSGKFVEFSELPYTLTADMDLMLMK